MRDNKSSIVTNLHTSLQTQTNTNVHCFKLTTLLHRIVNIHTYFICHKLSIVEYK